MTERTILPFGDPALRKQAKPVTEITPRILKILDDMVDTLYAAEGRAGLAAPQIGILRRLAVLDCGGGLIELINPEIIEQTGEQTGPESCLSYPGYYGVVTRAARVKVRTRTREGGQTVLEAEGYTARCLQHEIDHLDGVLFVDHVKDRWLYHEGGHRKVDVLEVIRLTRSNL